MSNFPNIRCVIWVEPVNPTNSIYPYLPSLSAIPGEGEEIKWNELRRSINILTSRWVIWVVKPGNPNPYPPSLSIIPNPNLPPLPSIVPVACDIIVEEGWEEIMWNELRSINIPTSRRVIWVAKPGNPRYPLYPYLPSLSTIIPDLNFQPLPSLVPGFDRDVIVGEGWEKFIWGQFQERNELNEDYFRILLDKIHLERQEATIYPAHIDMFAWTKYCRPEEVKVVIVGQDPYHDGAAHGLAFSMRGKIPQYSSLMNIMTLLPRNWDETRNCPKTDLQIPLAGNLEGWAIQGVLLLNRILTVKEREAGSHKDLGWETFTKNIIEFLHKDFGGIVFILWGEEAKRLCSILRTEKNKCLIDWSYKKCPACPPTAHHCLTHVTCENCGRGTHCGMSGNVVLQSGHPSPRVKRGDFLRQNHLLMANKLLNSKGKNIYWEYGLSFE